MLPIYGVHQPITDVAESSLVEVATARSKGEYLNVERVQQNTKILQLRAIKMHRRVRNIRMICSFMPSSGPRARSTRLPVMPEDKGQGRLQARPDYTSFL